ncbi:MAG: WD40 repeat domain-containing protein [Cyanobacteria bacterium]|nr:WD40 repeat domain-containing protein [Cyanobacteriota bacterium]
MISREYPGFSCDQARLTVGRDGMVYLCDKTSDENQSCYVLRMTKDGRERFGGTVVYAAANATANGSGVIATANGHFTHSLTLYDAKLSRQANVSEFLVNDKVGWNAPIHVEAGESGDFFGADQYRDRIIRIRSDGKLLKTYSIPRSKSDSTGLIWDFRVCEKTRSFYVLSQSGISCVSFDGQLHWYCPGNFMSDTGYIYVGVFDVDEHGVVYSLPAGGDVVKILGPTGKSIGEIKLKMPARNDRRSNCIFTALRLCGGELILKERSDTELFRRYERATGALIGTVECAHERLTVNFSHNTWIAGQSVPFSIKLDSRGVVSNPRWRIWAKEPGSISYREFDLKGGKLLVPKDASGIYQIKVTPEVVPLVSGEPSEYMVRAWVEIRQPGTTGTASVQTPDNRIFYGRGEEIPLSVSVRSGEATVVPVEIQLVQQKSSPRIIATCKGAINPGKSLALLLPGTLTAALQPGQYEVRVAARALTCISQSLIIGPGIDSSPLKFIEYGDYPPTYPTGDLWDASDRAAAHSARTSKLGFNLLVDRLGTVDKREFIERRFGKEAGAIGEQRMNEPPTAAPEKLIMTSPLSQVMSAYSAQGIQEMAILMRNDAGLPLGTGFDQRKLPELTETISRVTKSFSSYPAFRGWSWSSNWWVLDERGANAAKTVDEKQAYLAALKKARDKGIWNPVLDRVSGYRLAHAVDAQDKFNRTLKKTAPDLVTASASPYRHVEAYPPISLSNVDEVDLQAQWEQIALPYHVPHNVDFYKRPGKRAWAHPEIWNDAGTGEQILSTLFMGLMRGVDGVGLSPPLLKSQKISNDPRTSYQGTSSIVRSLGEILRSYGPWLSSLENNDRLAIVVSGRMLKIDEWTSVMGQHFARLFEAYASCLHAHHPASFVFVDDLKPETLQRFKAVLVVGQTVEMEPALSKALHNARAKGIKVLYDKTCRSSLVMDFSPLEIAFDQFEKDHSPAGDDSAYLRFQQYCKRNVAELHKALDPIVPPVARVLNDEFLVSERRCEDGRYLFVVNDTMPDIKFGQLTRMTLAISSRMPAKATVHCQSTSRFVYDVFAGRQITELGTNGKDIAISADCRSMPARIFAILPAAIDRVEVSGPEVVDAGERFVWSVKVQDRSAHTIRASIPVRARLLDSSGEVLEERFVAAGSMGASGVFMTSINGSPREARAIEVTELITGKSARLAFKVRPAVVPNPEAIQIEFPGRKVSRASQTKGSWRVAGHRTSALKPSRSGDASQTNAGANTVSVGMVVPKSYSCAENLFGPHVRDVALTHDSSLAVMNTMNWDHNIYAVDTDTGKLRWRQRVGNYFAFSPQGVGNGFAVQGFDFRSAEGYHLYLGNKNGKLERRFALYGLPHRLCDRTFPFIVFDRINQFAVSPAGRWVAASGDFGLAVWTREGKLLWLQEWSKSKRHSATIATLDEGTLLLVKDTKAIAYSASEGKVLWQTTFAKNGEVDKISTSSDGETCALSSTSEGGRIYILRHGKLLAVIPSAALDFTVSPDGAHLAIVDKNHKNQLKLHAITGGLRWTLPADDALHFPRFSLDGQRVAVSSELGTFMVLDVGGEVKLKRDCSALAVPAWLPDGDLLLANWMGTVCRLDSTYRERWCTRLAPVATDMRGKLLDDDRIPTVRIDSWVNNAPGPAANPPQLLSSNNVAIRFCATTQRSGQAQTQFMGMQNPVSELVDGKTTPPANPWLRWCDIGFFAGLWDFNYLLLDTYRTQLRLSAVTLVEDAAHPESWLRDATLEYWDASIKKWVFSQTLLSNAATHTHLLAKPVEAARFRIVMPWGLCGNLRLAEIVLHGKKLGSSHPDVMFRRPVAELSDDGTDLDDTLVQGSNGLAFQYSDAFSGDRCLELTADCEVCPPDQPPFGNTLPNWDFEITEKPRLGQYRYLQFACKAAPKTKGIALHLGSSTCRKQLSCYAGELKPATGVACQISGAPPMGWQVVRVDLWKAVRKPFRIQSMILGSKGGTCWFDQILLARSEDDFPKTKKLNPPLRSESLSEPLWTNTLQAVK